MGMITVQVMWSGEESNLVPRIAFIRPVWPGILLRPGPRLLRRRLSLTYRPLALIQYALRFVIPAQLRIHDRRRAPWCADRWLAEDNEDEGAGYDSDDEDGDVKVGFHVFGFIGLLC
jgi:hypothetical protein